MSVQTAFWRPSSALPLPKSGSLSSSTPSIASCSKLLQDATKTGSSGQFRLGSATPPIVSPAATLAKQPRRTIPVPMVHKTFCIINVDGNNNNNSSSGNGVRKKSSASSVEADLSAQTVPSPVAGSMKTVNPGAKKSGSSRKISTVSLNGNRLRKRSSTVSIDSSSSSSRGRQASPPTALDGLGAIKAIEALTCGSLDNRKVSTASAPGRIAEAKPDPVPTSDLAKAVRSVPLKTGQKPIVSKTKIRKQTVASPYVAEKVSRFEGKDIQGSNRGQNQPNKAENARETRKVSIKATNRKNSVHITRTGTINNNNNNNRVSLQPKRKVSEPLPRHPRSGKPESSETGKGPLKNRHGAIENSSSGSNLDQQPDLVRSSSTSNAASIALGTRASALDQKILSEAKHASTGFAAMAVLVNHLAAKRIWLEEALLQHHKEKMDEANAASPEKPVGAKNWRTWTQEEVARELARLQDQHITVIEKIRHEHQLEREKLEGLHESRTRQLREASIDRETEMGSDADRRLREASDKWRSELESRLAEADVSWQERFHEWRLKEERWEEQKKSLEDTIHGLRSETKELNDFITVRKSKDSSGLKAVREQQVGGACEAEVESLKAVLDMKTGEVHRLRKEKALLDEKLEEFDKVKTELKKARATVEDLKEQLNSKMDLERKLSAENHKLSSTVEREMNEKKRLSMENEELQWKIRQNLDLSSSCCLGSFGGSNTSINASNSMLSRSLIEGPYINASSTPCTTNAGTACTSSSSWSLQDSGQLLHHPIHAYHRPQQQQRMGSQPQVCQNSALSQESSNNNSPFHTPQIRAYSHRWLKDANFSALSNCDHGEDNTASSPYLFSGSGAKRNAIRRGGPLSAKTPSSTLSSSSGGHNHQKWGTAVVGHFSGSDQRPRRRKKDEDVALLSSSSSRESSPPQFCYGGGSPWNRMSRSCHPEIMGSSFPGSSPRVSQIVEKLESVSWRIDYSWDLNVSTFLSRGSLTLPGARRHRSSTSLHHVAKASGSRMENSAVRSWKASGASGGHGTPHSSQFLSLPLEPLQGAQTPSSTPRKSCSSFDALPESSVEELPDSLDDSSKTLVASGSQKKAKSVQMGDTSEEAKFQGKDVVVGLNTTYDKKVDPYFEADCFEDEDDDDVDIGDVSSSSEIEIEAGDLTTAEVTTPQIEEMRAKMKAALHHVASDSGKSSSGDHNLEDDEEDEDDDDEEDITLRDSYGCLKRKALHATSMSASLPTYDLNRLFGTVALPQESGGESLLTIRDHGEVEDVSDNTEEDDEGRSSSSGPMLSHSPDSLYSDQKI